MTRLFSFQWEELKAAKPVEGEEDPELLEEIAEARKNLGQFTRNAIQCYCEMHEIHKSSLFNTEMARRCADFVNQQPGRARQNS